MGEITSENLALTCAPRYAHIRGSPPVFAPVFTQLVTQALTPCHIAWVSMGGEVRTRRGVSAPVVDFKRQSRGQGCLGALAKVDLELGIIAR
jgi:hypothetical protein